MHELIYPSEDNYLWREMFLGHPFDDPRKAVILSNSSEIPFDGIDWKSELQRRVKAERVLRTDFADLARAGQGHAVALALSTVIAVVESARQGSNDDEAHNIAWAHQVLTGPHSHTVLADTSLHSTHPVVLQHQARLRCYLALSHERAAAAASVQRLQAVRSRSRAYVYDLRKYARATLWGPYALRDGALVANWVHLEHIVNVVVLNARATPSEWKDVWPPWGLDATRAYSAPRTLERDPRDWAGVEGRWRRVVCFMDYRYAHDHDMSTPKRLVLIVSLL